MSYLYASPGHLRVYDDSRTAFPLFRRGAYFSFHSGLSERIYMGGGIWLKGLKTDNLFSYLQVFCFEFLCIPLVNSMFSYVVNNTNTSKYKIYME